MIEGDPHHETSLPAVSAWTDLRRRPQTGIVHIPQWNVRNSHGSFDRLDLDAWVDEYKSRNGRPALTKGVNASWDANAVPAPGYARGSGTSRSRSTEESFAKALERAGLKRRN